MKTIIDGKMCKLADAPAESLEEKVQRLLDIEEIKSIMYQYAYYTDLLDKEGLSSLFTEDAVWYSNGLGLVRGKKAIADGFGGMYEEEKSATHLMGNQQVWFETKDKARMHTYFHSWSCFHEYPAKYDRYTYGRYEIVAVREEDGEWRCSEIRLVIAGQPGAGGLYGQQFDRPWPPEPGYGF
jgi:ketosteroid isomerase-like protein